MEADPRRRHRGHRPRHLDQHDRRHDLTVAWRAPDFDAKQPAFYYVRVLEIPTPRWTAYDAPRFGVATSDDARARWATSPCVDTSNRFDGDRYSTVAFGL